MTTGNEESRGGAAAALSAFLIWGLLPVYWKQLAHVNPLEVISSRGLWSLVCILPVVLFTRRVPEVLAAFKGRNFILLAASSAILACNWLVFIWAVGNGNILETSLGNFMNPLINMLCGVIFFRDRMSATQCVAVCLVALAVVARVVCLGYFPWIALALCLSFAGYGMLRKVVAVESLPGLLVETTFFTPFALLTLIWLHSRGELAFGANAATTALLVCSGFVTSIPMALFAYAARHLKLTTLGVFHYIVPTCSFILGVFVYREPFSTMNFATFAVIWLAIALYTADRFRRRA